MPFKKGDKKPENSGRKKGVRNKTTNFVEACNNFDLDILACLIEDMKDMAPFQRVDYWAKLLEYYYPKKKAPLEIGNADGEGFKIVIEDYSKK